MSTDPFTRKVPTLAEQTAQTARDVDEVGRNPGRFFREGTRSYVEHGLGGVAVFERCRFGDRVSTCYHNPRCYREASVFGRYVAAQCHICSGQADGTCAICDRPVCDEDARHQDHDRFCRSCAPHPGGA
jgi:hypothetical protein